MLEWPAIFAGEDGKELPRHALAKMVRTAAEENARLDWCRQVFQDIRPRRRAGTGGAPRLQRLTQLLKRGLRRSVRKQIEIAVNEHLDIGRGLGAVEHFPQVFLGGVGERGWRHRLPRFRQLDDLLPAFLGVIQHLAVSLGRLSE